MSVTVTDSKKSLEFDIVNQAPQPKVKDFEPVKKKKRKKRGKKNQDAETDRQANLVDLDGDLLVADFIQKLERQSSDIKVKKLTPNASREWIHNLKRNLN